MEDPLASRALAVEPLDTDVERLLQVVQQLSTVRTIEEVQEIVRRAARHLTGADGATFVLRDGDQCFYVDEDAIQPLWKGRRFPMSACVSGWAMLNRDAAVIEDIYNDSRIPIDAYEPTFVRSLAMMPIRRSQPLGAIGVYWARRHRANPHHLRVLQALADSTSTAIENVRLLADLRVAKEAAEASLRLKNEFLATVSHELRTPLTPIVAWASLLASGLDDPEALREAAVTIHENALLEVRQIERLLDVSQLVAGTLPLRIAPTRLAPLLREVVAELTADAAGKGLVIDMAIDDGGPEVAADGARLRQVVANLIDNAIKFTPAGGRIRVVLEHEGARTSVVVADTGIGIPSAFVPHLFERFRQADGSSTRERGGMGLGLALVRHLVELHGGTVHATSEGPGRGAAFTVVLPAATG